MNRVLDICQKENLDVVMIEDKVYKNNTSDKVVNIDKLKRELENCRLIISDIIKREKINGVSDKYCKVYYFIDDIDNNELLLSIFAKAEAEYGDIYLDVFKPSPDGDNSIDTIYGSDELGVANNDRR